MLSQFIGAHKGNFLGAVDFDFPVGTHAIGRLDSHSEGLLLLTTNKKITKLLFESKVPHKRTYLVLVKNIVSSQTLERLRSGVTIRIKAGVNYITPPCDVQIVQKPEGLFAGQFEQIETWPHTWLMITLTEGKYHQVRKMVFALGHRCQRLIRLSIEDMHLGNLQPGCVCEVSEDDFFDLLKLKRN